MKIATRLRPVWRRRMPITAAAITATALTFMASPGSHTLSLNAADTTGTPLSAVLSQMHLTSVRHAPPVTCAASRLIARASGATSGTDGSAVVLELRTSGRACSVAGYPTVRLRLADGTSPVAKEFGYLPAGRTGISALTAYVQGNTARPVLVVRPDRWVRVVLVAPAVRGTACHLARSATVYPTSIALGPGAKVALPHPVAVCGPPRALPFQPASMRVSSAMSLADRAIASVQPAASRLGDGPSGFWYGNDGPGPGSGTSNNAACGSAPPFKEASADSSTNPCATTDGAYAGYIGEVGTWGTWKGCAGAGSDFNQTDAQDAVYDRSSPYNEGVGVQGYWMLAGPGRDGSPTSGSAATLWGQDQAIQAANYASNSFYFLPGGATAGPYIYMDLETNASSYNNGWNESFSSVCATSGSSYTNTGNNQNVFNAFYNYLENNTSLYPAVYSVQSIWSQFMGSKNLGNTAEWTWNGNNPNMSPMPYQWGSGGYTAAFFAQAPGNCQTVWQWSGGPTTNNTGLRFDQFDGNNFPDVSSSPCQ